MPRERTEPRVLSDDCDDADDQNMHREIPQNRNVHAKRRRLHAVVRQSRHFYTSRPLSEGLATTA